jgi:hypothetical protein
MNEKVDIFLYVHVELSNQETLVILKCWLEHIILNICII